MESMFGHVRFRWSLMVGGSSLCKGVGWCRKTSLPRRTPACRCMVPRDVPLKKKSNQKTSKTIVLDRFGL